MPQVDFTLEDMRGLIGATVKAEVAPLWIEFRALRSEFNDFQQVVADSFQELGDDMNAQFDEVRGELKAIRRVTRQHSADIVELRAAQGRT